MRLGRMVIKAQQDSRRKPRSIRLTLYGDPVGKARPRVTRTKTGKSLTYTPSRTAQAEERWKALFLESEQQPFPEGTPLSLLLRAYLNKPQYLRKRARLPITKPDLDNLVKLVTDALEELAYHRDSNFVAMSLSKHYAAYPDPPRVEIEISEASEND
ncbi:RusA family crossover junction endodeoxyribonuclease [Dehalococcoidia bacterium]|nr:RusA family crossover junction endodeoxyribonuclease [Dehalococcoidia bacterium]